MPQALVADPPGFAELSKSEQVEYLQALWDRIAEAPTAVPSPESHLAIAEQRLECYRRDPSRAHSAFAVIDRLTGTSR